MTDSLTPERARDIDYGLQKLRFASLGGACAAWLFAAILFVVSNNAVAALIVGVGYSAGSLVTWMIVSKVLRRELAAFTDPATGELSIPGGRRVLKAREAFVLLYLSTRQERFLWVGLLAGILLLAGFLVAD